MRAHDGHTLFAASDLINFTGCRHSTFLDLRFLNDPQPQESDPLADLLQQKGLDHERAFLASLDRHEQSIVSISSTRGLDERIDDTRRAMHSGASIIYQGALLNPPWHGYADFLRRVETPSALGPYSYEVIDTKLARHTRPKHVVQLCVYSELLAREQGTVPERMHVVLGDARQESLRTTDYAHFFHGLREQFEGFGANLPVLSEPEPCAHCETCRWVQRCEEEWERTEHLSLTAGITREQSVKLRSGGVATLRDLGNHTAGAIPTLLTNTLERLTAQAALQIRKRDTGENCLELLPLQTAKGFSRLPDPDDGDLFFDMEGDPLYPGGLEYLFGFLRRQAGDLAFIPFWAHDREEEKRAFEAAVDYINEHLARHPNAHVYHYNHYEMTAFKHLSSFHQTRETDVDNYLRRHVFVDLYKVVREGLRISEPGYSLKNVETFYMGQREGSVKTAGDSLISYELWRQTNQASLLQEIESYNEQDCRSTALLQEWLLRVRPQDTSYSAITEAPNEVKAKKQAERERVVQTYREQLAGGATNEELGFRELISQLLEFHRRESKPEWWAMFDRQGRTDEELINDAECLGGLRLDEDIAPFRDPAPRSRSTIYTYRFPAQDSKIRVGNECLRSETLEPAGEVVGVDENALRIELKLGPSRSALPTELSLIPAGPIGDEVLRAGIYRFADSVLAQTRRYPAVEATLTRSLPILRGREAGSSVVNPNEDLLTSSIGAICALENSYLLVQGPPGSGKTYTASHAIVRLLRNGFKIGVSSNSHKAINKLLGDVEKLATSTGVSFRGIKKSTTEDQAFNGAFIQNVFDNKEVDTSASLLAGTAWLFARPDLDQVLDYLFVDEAGQVSLANVVAMGISARNIVLIGDQMQLAQPIQGVHPGDSGKSVLEFLLRDDATVSSERGIFLSTTRRMHRNLCTFISDAVYDGRLEPDVSNQMQTLVLNGAHPAVKAVGLSFVELVHHGCSQKSEPEAAEIRRIFESLQSQRWIDREGIERPVTAADILVISPYNMQVNLLRSLLPMGVRVGTVDKLQGQEAAVVLISMATSSAEELPRDIEFLFSRNRLNVAISRARCLAVIVTSDRLLEVPCHTVEQMRLVNTLCWAKAYARRESRQASGV
ncbi:MAG: TM0106 family RecB-like putative nuclease [Ignavibacteriota bacterium]